MTEKKVKDRQTQNEFLAKIQQCLDKFDEADALFDDIDDFINNKMPEEQSKYGNEQQDFLHLIENYQLNDEQLLALGRKLEKNRNERRNWDNIARIALIWKTNKAKVYNRNSRIFLKEQLQKGVNGLDNDWRFRTLSQSDLEKLFDEPIKKKETKKKGRTPISKEIIGNIISKYEQGLKARKISEILNMKLPTVYAIIKKYKDGKLDECLSNA